MSVLEVVYDGSGHVECMLADEAKSDAGEPVTYQNRVFGVPLMGGKRRWRPLEVGKEDGPSDWSQRRKDVGQCAESLVESGH
jgi:hypothetical protein